MRPYLGAPMNRFSPNFGCGCFSSCSTDTWYQNNEIQKKFFVTSLVLYSIVSVAIKFDSCKLQQNCTLDDCSLFTAQMQPYLTMALIRSGTRVLYHLTLPAKNLACSLFTVQMQPRLTMALNRSGTRVLYHLTLPAKNLACSLFTVQIQPRLTMALNRSGTRVLYHLTMPAKNLACSLFTVQMQPLSDHGSEQEWHQGPISSYLAS